MQTLAGPLVGALVVVTMQNYFASFAEVVLMLQGLVFIVVVLVFRRGVVGEWLAWRQRRSDRAASTSAASSASSSSPPTPSSP